MFSCKEVRKNKKNTLQENTEEEEQQRIQSSKALSKLALNFKPLADFKKVDKVNRYFNRRNILYIENTNGVVRRVKVEDIKNSDPQERA